MTSLKVERRFCVLLAVVLNLLAAAMTRGATVGALMPGDADNNRNVNINDLAVVSSNFGRSGAEHQHGDFDGDGQVGINDLAILSSHFGQSTQPLFDSSVPGGVIDFGDIPLLTTAEFTLTIFNVTTNVHPGLEGLSDLTLLDATFGGLTPEFFSLQDFTPGTRIAPGESLDLTIELTPTVAGPVEGTLTLLTDQGAGLGVAGQSFSYTLLDDAIAVQSAPTPGAALGGLGLLAITFMRRKSTRRGSPRR